MQIPKIFRKTSKSDKIVAISFSADGIAVAISKRLQDKSLSLIDAEFIVSSGAQVQQQALDDFVTSNELGGCICHLVLADNDYRRINIEAPNVATNEMIGAIRWKINEHLDFPVDTAVIDYYPATGTGRDYDDNRLEVIACQQKIIQAYTENCTRTGLKIKVIDIQETCLRNLAVLLPENAKGVSLVHLQETSGVVLIQKEAIIYVCRKFDLGYKKLELHAPFIKDVAPEAAHTNLVLEIQRSLDYAQSFYELLPVSAISIIPFGDYSLDLVNTLNNNYGFNADIVNLSTLVGSEIELDFRTQSLCATVIGASLRNSEKTGYLQEVNLYQPPEQQHSVLPVYLAILSLLILPVLIYSGFLVKELKQLEAQVQQTQKILNEEDARLKLALASVPKTVVNPDLDKDIVQWQKALIDLDKSVEQIANKNAIQTSGFSSFFQALANQSTTDIWLTKLYFNGQQHIIKLEGSTLKPEQLPIFLQSLQQLSVFKGFSFASLFMQQSETNRKQTDFKLSTTLETEDRKEHVH